MRRILYISIFAISLCGSFVSEADSINQENSRQVIVQFTTPLPMNRIPALVKRFDLRPKELYYKIDDVSGGYKILEGENISRSIRNIIKKHRQFLTKSITSNESLLPTIEGGIAIYGLVDLNERLKKLLNEVRSKNFHISSVKLDNDLNISALAKKGNVKRVIPVFKNTKRETLKKYDEDLGTKDYTNPKSSSHEYWAPYGGTSTVTQSMIYQTFYFNNPSPSESNSTYEHETQIYDSNFADYNDYWCSNLPNAYYDTPFLDDKDIDNFTIGSAQASSIEINKMYFTYMSLKGGPSSSATVRIKGQKGYRFPSWCYSTWCIYREATTDSMITFTAPIEGICWVY